MGKMKTRITAEDRKSQRDEKSGEGRQALGGAEGTVPIVYIVQQSCDNAQGMYGWQCIESDSLSGSDRRRYGERLGSPLDLGLLTYLREFSRGTGLFTAVFTAPGRARPGDDATGNSLERCDR